MLSHSALNDQLWLYIFSFIDPEYACKSLLLIHKKWLRLIYQDQELWKMWYFKYPWFLGLSNLDKSIYNTLIVNNNYQTHTNYANGNYRQPSKREWNELFLRRVKTDNNWKRGRFIERRLERAHCLAVAAIQCDESVLVTGSYDESIKVWDISKGECVRVLYNTGWISCLQFKDTFMINGSDDGLRVWHLDTQRCVKHLEAGQKIACLKFLDNVLVTSTGTTEINTIWDLEPLKPLAYLPKSYVSSLSIYNKTLVTGSLDGVGMYDLNSYKCVKKFNYPTDGVQFDDHTLVTRIGQILNVWDMRTGRCLMNWKDVKIINNMILEGSKVLSCTCAGSMRLWDISSAKANLLTVTQLDVGQNNVVVSLDTNWERIVAGFWDGDITVIDY